MTAGQQASAVFGGAIFSVVARPDAGVTLIGHSFGSLTPGSSIAPALYRGQTFYFIGTSVGAGYDFYLSFMANLPQNFFEKVEVLATNGVRRTFYASAVTAYQPGAQTNWIWGNGSSRVWTASGTYPAIISP